MSDTDKKFTILAVDDTPENLDVVKGILTPEFIVKAATSGAMALKIAEKQAPDLILLDIMMPEMDGYEVCRRLKADEQTRDIPVIFLTAMDQTTDEAQGFDLGAADYMKKPVNPPILQARVRTHLALKQSMDELQSAYVVISKHKERMEQELNIGHEIQMSMLPQEFPAFPDRSEFTVYAKLEPAREVGGDFYDYFIVNDDLLYCVVGDVSGKGAGAALFMALSKALIKTKAQTGMSPADIITSVNNEIAENNEQSMFVTLFIVMINLRNGESIYCNAGHNPTHVLRSDGSQERLDRLHGPVVGAIEDISYGQDTFNMDRGEKIFLYTDGVTEAMNVQEELYTEERLANLLSANLTCDTAELVKVTLDDVETFAGDAEQADDITIVALEIIDRMADS